MIKYVISSFYLCTIVQQILCFTPNCVPDNQFRFYQFPVEGCSEFFPDKCKFHPQGNYKALGDTPLVKVGETPVLPTCAFFNNEKLKEIYAVNSKIKVLATGAFVKLSNLKAIHLSYNHITEVRSGVFQSVVVEMLDLSWNKIVFIDQTVFKEVNNLQYLNLSRNSLLTLPLSTLSKALVHLNLAHNFLSRVAVNSNKFPNLTHLDLSHNSINKIAMSFENTINIIDLTNNRLKNFDYLDIFSIDKFKMSKNFFETVPQYFENINAKEVDIYPNPWKCDELLLLWDKLISLNYRLAPRKPGKNPPPECAKLGGIKLEQARDTDCIDDHECPSSMACRTGKCWNPCEANFCHASSTCKTVNHVFTCSCASGTHFNPLDIYTTCRSVECFINDHCKNDDEICLNEVCETVQFLAPSPQPDRRPQAGKLPSTPLITDSTPDPLPWWYDDIPKLEP